MYQKGEILLGKYRIYELIWPKQTNQKVLAEVYRVKHLDLDVDRALKILRKETPGLGKTEYGNYEERFRLEAQLGAKIDDPHIIHVYDFERDGEDLILVMEYAAGGSLAEKIQQANENDKPFEVDEAVQVAIDVAQGLSILHKKPLEVVHRDLKPSNILFDGQGHAKVADLGLAQIPGGFSMRYEISNPPPHPGTPAYRSPEHADSTNYLKSPSDIYALGLVLFESLTGSVYAFQRQGTRAKAIRRDVPSWLDELVVRMLSTVPEKRPWDGEEAAGLLRKGIKNERKPRKGRKRKTGKTPSNLLVVLKSVFKKAAPAFRLVGILGVVSVLLWGGSLVIPNLQALIQSAEETFTQAQPTPTKTTHAIIESVIPSSPSAPTGTNTPEPLEDIIDATPVSWPSQMISPENANNVIKISELAIGKSNRLVFSPNLQAVAVELEKSVEVYRIFDGFHLGGILDDRGGYQNRVIALSPSGDLMAFGYDNGSINIFRVSDGELMISLKPGAGEVEALSYSHDGKILSSVNNHEFTSDEIYLWTIPDGEVIKIFHFGGGHASDLIFSMDGKTLAVGSFFGWNSEAMRILDITKGELKRILGQPELREIALSADGLIAGTMGGDINSSIQLWKTSNGTRILVLEEIPFARCFALSRSGNLLAVGDTTFTNDNEWNATISLWDVDRDTLIQNLTGSCPVAFSPDGTMFVSGSVDGSVQLWGIVP